MEKAETFQVSNLYGEYVQKTIEDCLKDFEKELEKTGLKISLINNKSSIEILHAYINSDAYFSEVLRRQKEELYILLPKARDPHLNDLSMGLLKAIIFKFHHHLFQKEDAIELAKEVFHHSITCMEKRTGFNYCEYEKNESFAIKGANERHKENRETKEYVFKWLDKNFHAYKSMDAAAEAIAGKEVNMSFRTVRKWIPEWKKLRSAGTA